MRIEEIKKTHENLNDKEMAAVGIKGYQIYNDMIQLWDGKQWCGWFKIENNEITNKPASIFG